MFTFIIPTKKNYDNQDVQSNLKKLILSIHEDIEYTRKLKSSVDFISPEIITIGDLSGDADHIEFDGNISQKLNMGAAAAKHKYLIWIRDYMWIYQGYLASWSSFLSQNELDIGMNIVLNKDGTRFRDVIAFDDEELNPCVWIQVEKWCPNGIIHMAKPILVPYNYTKTNKMSISGGYFLAKKEFMLENPFNENLALAQAEDIEFSLRVRHKWKYVVNTGAKVGLSKFKDRILPIWCNNDK